MFEFLEPISKEIQQFKKSLPSYSIGFQLQAHLPNQEPKLSEKGSIVLFFVEETRNSVDNKNAHFDFDAIRKQLYKLAKGNWGLKIYDFGTIKPGNTIEDTYFVVKKIISEVKKQDCIPVILGGSQDLVYPIYKAYNPKDGMVNLVNIDARFDLGNVDLPITNQSFIGKIVMDQPYNLFNYSNLGYQNYYVAPEELDLIEQMFFEGYRLGELISDITIAEPVLRSADIVSIDMNAMSAAYYGDNPNGFTGREICALARYSGISDKVSTFGIFEYNSELSTVVSNQLIAQLIWYFVEGVSNRWHEGDNINKMDVFHYQVPIDNEVLSFYKSKITERWWMEILYNNSETNALLPCSYTDYLSACNQKVPIRWYNAKMKYEL